MLAYTYIEKGKFALVEKPKPTLIESTDAIVRVTMGSICTSDLHIKHGSVPRAVPGITVGHEMVGVVEEAGADVTHVKPGDRVTVNVETFCGECFFCKNGFVNNCTDPNGGWALGCRIDGGQTEYVRVPLANQGLNRIPDSVTDEQALLVGDVLATGFWAARISEITEEDTVLIIGAGPTGICTLLCAMLRQPKRIIVCEKSEERRRFVQEHYPEVLSKHNKVDIIVNNALPLMKGIDECTYEEFQYALSVGVTAPFYLVKLFMPHLADGASIINISSSRDRMSQPQTESYTAAKGGIAALTHALAVSLSGKARVNSISPGWIDTAYTVYEGPDATQQPAGRVGNPMDIANMVLFLCSDKAGFITGENICIDGGMTKQMIYHGDCGWELDK